MSACNTLCKIPALPNVIWLVLYELEPCLLSVGACLALRGRLALVHVIRWIDGAGVVGIWRQWGPRARCKHDRIKLNGDGHSCFGCRTSMLPVCPLHLCAKNLKIGGVQLEKSLTPVAPPPLRCRSRAPTCTYTRLCSSSITGGGVSGDGCYGGWRGFDFGCFVPSFCERGAGGWSRWSQSSKRGQRERMRTGGRGYL